MPYIHRDLQFCIIPTQMILNFTTRFLKVRPYSSNDLDRLMQMSSNQLLKLNPSRLYAILICSDFDRDIVMGGLTLPLDGESIMFEDNCNLLHSLDAMWSFFGPVKGKYV